MSKRKQIRVWVDESTLEYIENKKFTEDYRTLGESLDAIVKSEKDREENEFSLSYIAEKSAQTISSLVMENLSNELNKIRLGTNNTDRNTQILIELMNGHLDQLDYEHFLTTDLQECLPLEYSKQVVNDRIKKQKQRKDTYTN